MANYDLPVAAVLPGDPAVLREAAADVRRVAGTVGQDASAQAAASRAAAAGGWHGPAADAFAAAASDARARIDTLVGIVHTVPGPLLRFADVLERAQREYAAAQAGYQQTAAVIRATRPGAPTAQALGDAYFGAQTRMDRIVAEVAAAAEVDAITARLSSEAIAADKLALTASSTLVGLGLSGSARAASEVLGADSATAGAYSTLGYVLTPVTSTLSELIEDSENPYYSAAERIGRGVGKAIVNGIPDALLGGLGASAGTYVGGWVGGPLAPLTGTVGGAVGGGVAAHYTDRAVSRIPIQDDVVDAAGEAFDAVAGTVSDVADDVSGTASEIARDLTGGAVDGPVGNGG